VPWRLVVKTEETTDYNLGYSFYIGPDDDDKKLKANPLNVNLTLKIIHLLLI
jgi:hypothetical protein